jgi:hypothetical protein
MQENSVLPMTFHCIIPSTGPLQQSSEVEFRRGGRNVCSHLHKKVWFESSSVKAFFEDNEAQFGDVLYCTEGGLEQAMC